MLVYFVSSVLTSRYVGSDYSICFDGNTSTAFRHYMYDYYSEAKGGRLICRDQVSNDT